MTEKDKFIEEALTRIQAALPDPFSQIALAMTILDYAGQKLGMTSDEMITNVFKPAFDQIHKEEEHD